MTPDDRVLLGFLAVLLTGVALGFGWALLDITLRHRRRQWPVLRWPHGPTPSSRCTHPRCTRTDAHHSADCGWW